MIESVSSVGITFASFNIGVAILGTGASNVVPTPAAVKPSIAISAAVNPAAAVPAPAAAAVAAVAAPVPHNAAAPVAAAAAVPPAAAAPAAAPAPAAAVPEPNALAAAAMNGARTAISLPLVSRPPPVLCFAAHYLKFGSSSPFYELWLRLQYLPSA